MYCEEKLFQNYLADAAKILTENTATQERKYLTMRFADLVSGKEPQAEPSAEEIVADIRRRIEEDT